MLQLYDLNKNKIAGLTKYKDLKIESTLSTGDKVLSFSYPKALSNGIQEEGYIRTKKQEYVIKQLGKSYDDYITVSCNLNLEEIEGKTWESFSSVEQTVENAIKLAIAGTGWTVKNNGVTKKRTIRKTGCSALDIIQQCIKTYHCEIKYDSINKVINVYDTIGIDKGAYFSDQLNLKELSIQSDSYGFYTIIEAYGKGDIHCTVENYQYSKKKKALYWKDERYTVLSDLKEDAILKLAEMSTPTRAYKASIYDLARLSDKYKNILDYALGDTITLIDKDTDTRLKQRIVKTVEYPDNPENNAVEISNTFASFEDIQKEQQDTTGTVNNITEDNGTISINALQSGWVELNKVNVQEFNAVKANIGTLNANEVIADELHAHTASINTLYVDKANILDLNAANAKIGTLESKTASIDNLLNGNLTSANMQAGAIQAGSSIIANSAIGSAQISDLSATKLTAGIINTAVVTIQGANGRMTLKNNRIQVFDTDNSSKLFERISIGDVNGDGTKYGMRIRGADGKTILYDENGQTKEGFTDGYSKLADNSLDSKKIDIDSVVTRINAGTTLITGTKVQVGDRSLDVAFSTLSNTVSTNGSTLSSHTSSISALQDSVKLKLDTQTFKTYKSTNDSNISTINTNLSKATTDISVLQGQISLKVSQTDIDNSINSIEIGGRNLALGTGTWDNALEVNTGVTISGDTAVMTSETYPRTKGIPVNPKEQYTVSIDIKSSTSGTPTADCGMVLFDLLNSSNARVAAMWMPPRAYTTTWTRYYGTLTIPDDSSIKYLSIGLRNTLGINGLYFRHLKVEKGNKATDWTPAPEDTENEITTINTNVTTINNKQTELTTSLNGISATVTSQQSTLSTHTSQIGSLNSSVTTISSKVTNAETSITALQGQISLKVSQTDIDNSINNIEIGGRNLQLGSLHWDSTAFCSSAGVIIDGEIAEMTHENYPKGSAIAVKPKETYTLSIDIKSDEEHTPGTNKDSGVLLLDYYSNIEASRVTAQWIRGSFTTEWTRLIYTFTVPDNPDIKYVGIGLRDCLSKTVYFRHLKVEKGNKATDWTPAPEDTQSQIDTANNSITTISNKQAELTTSLNSITGRVSSTESSITTINGNITSLQNKVSAAEQKITADAIVNTVTSSTAYKDALSGKVDVNTYNSKVEQLSDSISNKVESSTYNSKMTQLDNSISSKVSQTDFNSYKTQTSDLISSKVAKSNFGSMITQNSDSVKIAFGDVGNGENLIKNGTFKFGTNNWSFNGETDYNYVDAKKWANSDIECIWFGTTASMYRGIFQKINGLTAGKQYTLSFEVTHDDIKANWTGIMIGIEGIWTLGYLPKEWTKITHTFTATKDTHAFIAYINGSNGGCFLRRIKLEEGDKATPWSAHKEEVTNASIKMDSTGVEVLNGSVTCRKNDCYSLLDYGQLGFATVSASSTEQVATVQAGWRQDIGSQNINGLFFSMLGHGDFLSFGATYGNYNDTLADEHQFRPIVDILNPNFGLFGPTSSQTCHVMVWDNVDMQTYKIKQVALEATSLKVSGSKQRIVATSDFGTVGMNAVESPDCLFEDVGDGHTDENGLCIIPLDPLFAETVDTNIMYQIFLQACGDGTLYVAERNEYYFVVKGTANLDFCWNIKAKQKGFSNTRLENDYIDDIIESTNDVKEETNENRELDNTVNDNDILSDVDNLLNESEA